MASISSTGLGSGLDIGGLVSKLVSAESTPVTNRINKREANLQAQFSAIGTFKGALSDLRSSVFSLSLGSTFNSKSASSANTNLFTATATQSAAVTSYNIKVNRLAEAHSLELASIVGKDDQFNTGKLKISVGTGEAKEVEIGAADNTLDGIAKAINKTPGVGVTATVLESGTNRQLVLKSSATGAENTIKIEVDGADEPGKLSLASTFAYSGADAGLKQLQAAQDASISIDGSTTETTSSSNTFAFSSGAMAGIGITLKSVGTDAASSTTKLTIGRSTEAATNAVNAFVKGFNSLTSTVKSLTSYDTQTKTAGALLGDAGVRSVNFQLKRMLGESIGGSSALQNLSSIGVETQRDGTLKVDSDKLSAALANDPDGVAALFLGAEATETSAAVEGIGDRFKNYLDKVLSSDGTLNSRLNSITKNISRLDDDREALSMRVDKLQTRLLKQFSAMDAMVGQLTNTSNFLTQQFDAMANMYKK